MSEDEARLSRLLHFDAADLSANRSGKLSERQRTRLTKRARRAGRARWVSLLLLGAAMAAGVVAFIVGLGGTAGWVGSAVIVAIGLVLGVVALAVTAHGNDLAGDVRSGGVAVATGTVHTWLNSVSHTVNSSSLEVGGVTFRAITPEIAAAFSPDITYTVCYLPTAMVILSAGRSA